MIFTKSLKNLPVFNYHKIRIGSGFLISELCIMKMYDYIKLSETEKEHLLRTDAIFLEHYNDDKKTVYVYFLNGFFVEVTMDNGNVVDNIPYQRGYKINRQNINSNSKYCMAA